ncbi:unnamed protein product [Dovyalis caffra]|uniref:Seed maturation protein LEA 4 n=1 Tax=Dovyalis caffra TaxID=77055 RepID=A0AAV1S1C8_9ROSI|nr:unnamed protein product [Dovyalis caffra]
MKETAANTAASAKAGMEKTKAAMQEKVEKMSAHDPVQKQMASEKKQERMTQAELDKLEAKQHNAASRQAGTATGRHGQYTAEGTGAYMTSGQDAHTHSATGVPSHPTGTHQMSAMPGRGTGQPYGGQLEEGVTRTHPSGLPGDTTGHNTRAGGTGYGTGGTGYGTGTGTGI